MPYYPDTRTKYSAYIGNLGWGGFMRYWLKRRTQKWATGDFSMRAPHARHPLQCRTGSSDLAVFKQIFAQREYACIDALPTGGPGLILDCGANAGFSTAYLLSRFPDSEVIAVEPDPGNFRALTGNVAPYGRRVRCVEAAIWSHPAQLDLSTSSGDGKEWSRTVAPSTETTGRHLISGMEIGQLIRESGHTRVRLLKMDIEGAEAVVFAASNANDWLPLVDAIVIELHGADCERIFENAVKPHGFQLRSHMELTIAERRVG